MAKIKPPTLFDEPVYTAEELGKLKKLHSSTVQKIFLQEEGVIRIGHPSNKDRGLRQHFTLRIPRSVAERVFGRLTFDGKAAQS
jgi:hypothetical protein